MPLQLDELPPFLQAAKTHRHGAMLAVAVFTGLRSSELRGLKWDDVDLDAPTLTVRRQVQREQREWKEAPLKSGSAYRTIPLPAQAVEAFRHQHRRQLEQRVLAGDRWDERGYIFTNSRGNPLADETARAVLDAADLPYRRFHDLRHTFASYLISHGADLMAVRDLCGHKDIQTTADVYGHLFNIRKVDVMASWDRLGKAS